MTREELRKHCEGQVQQFELVKKIMPVTPNDWKRYEEHKLILELLEQVSFFDKIIAEISCNIIEDDTSGNTPARLRADWAAANKAHRIDIAILNKYKSEMVESEET